MALTDKLVAYYKLDTDSTDVFGNNGTDTSMSYGTGKINGCGVFNGTSSFISTANISSLNSASAFTVSHWIYPTSVTGLQNLSAKWDYQTQGSYTALLNGTQILFYIANAINDAGNNGVFGGTAVINTWQHIVCVFDGSLTGNTNRAKIYYNGSALSLSSIGTIPATTTNGSATVKIGKMGGTVTRFFNGSIDEVGIWNKALSSDEVKDLYLNGSGSGYPFRDKMFF